MPRRDHYERRITMKACTCSMHCPLSGYHDTGCCARTTCDCWCHTPAAEHRGSRPGVDPLFHEAAASGFEPLSDGEREAMGQRMRDMMRVAGGCR